MKEQFLEAGKIINTFGIRGEVKLDPWCDSAEFLKPFKTLYIDDLCVDEDKRGMHIGRQLYDYVVEFAKVAGCYNLTLNVWSCNTGAMKFYEKCGLVPQKVGMELIL